jgi:TonB family protein
LRKDLYLLSGDDSLLLELGPLLGDRYRSRPIDAADQIDAVSLVPWLLIIDATARTDARAQAARIEQQHPLAPLLVICADGKATDWASPLGRGMVSAVVERSALAAALPEALMAIELRMNAAATAITSNAFADLAGPDHPAGSRRVWQWAAVVLVLLAAGSWYLLSDHAARTIRPAEPTSATVRQPIAIPGRPIDTAAPAAPAAAPAPTAAPPASVPAPPAPHRTVLELLSDARVAFRDERTLWPGADGNGRGDSALELYGAVLAQDPKNEEAREGMQRLYSVARTRIQSDIAAGKPDEATRLVAAFRDAGFAADGVAKLQADITAARWRALPAQARAAIANGDVDAANQLITQYAAAGGDRATLADLHHTVETYNATAELNGLGARARTAISSGALLEPATENARDLVQAMVQQNRTNPLTVTLQHELQVALLARAQSTSHAGQFDIAQQFLGAAAEYGANSDVANARHQLQSDMDAARERSAAAAPAPAAAPAATSTAAQPEYLLAKPLKPLTAVYPPQALQSGQAGYVIVEFMLDSKGRASKTTVVESSPPGVFDAAAKTAVNSGRYDTSALGGADKARRTRIRISFKP